VADQFRSELLDRLQFAAGLAATRLRLETQGDLAEKVGEVMEEGVIQSRMSRWVTLASDPPLRFYAALARLAGIDPGWLVMGGLSDASVPDAYLPLRAALKTTQALSPRGRGPDPDAGT
jgi:hypothetical protein